MQLLCTLRDRCRQRPRNTRYQADANPYLGRTYTGWIAPACGWRTYSITSSARPSTVCGTVIPSALAVFRLMLGAISLSSSSHFPLRLYSNALKPVVLPPVGFSKLAGSDEERTLARLRALRSDLIDPTIAVHNGRIVKRTGDGVLIEFRSVVDAVRCAIEMQNGMIERNAGLPPERRIEFRVGIHLGDVVDESDGDLMGDSVNIAARLEGIADPGGICLSEDAYRQVRDRLKEGFADFGEKELKNIARPVRVFAIKTASSGVTQELIASTPELGGDPEQEYFGGRQARRCAARGP